MDLYLDVGLVLRTSRRRIAVPIGDGRMELFLQFGYGMMDHSRSLTADWHGGTVILSPRDLTTRQLTRLAGEIRRLPGGSVLVDPQFYLPHADHERLRSHSYWPKDYDSGAFWQGSELENLLRELGELNGACGSRAFLLPGLIADQLSDEWFATLEAVQVEADKHSHGLPLIATLALEADVLAREENVEVLIDRITSLPVRHYYVVAEHPQGKYLVDDPSWLANLLDLVVALRLKGGRVIVGYCNHQMLILACAAASAICSGTWMNVRSFPPDKFRTPYEDEVKQRTTWYYCPQALSEFKIPFLDIAQRQNVLDQMRPPRGMESSYSAPLFTGVQPSSIGYTEQQAFRHYLHCLRQQVLSSAQQTFDATVDHHERLLTTAEVALTNLGAAGVRGQQRDFREIVDVNRAALAVLMSTRGAILRRKWNSVQ